MFICTRVSLVVRSPSATGSSRCVSCSGDYVSTFLLFLASFSFLCYNIRWNNIRWNKAFLFWVKVVEQMCFCSFIAASELTRCDDHVNICYSARSGNGIACTTILVCTYWKAPHPPTTYLPGTFQVQYKECSDKWANALWPRFRVDVTSLLVPVSQLLFFCIQYGGKRPILGDFVVW